MSENVENIVIEHLKALRNDLREFRTAHEQDMKDIKQRLNHVERGIISLKHDSVSVYEDQARQQTRLDDLAERIERLERRLELS